VIQGLESEAEWCDHRDDIVRGLAPIGTEEEALAEEMARVLWQQRRILRLAEHLRRVVAKERPVDGEAPPSVNAFRLGRLETLAAELERQLIEASHRLRVSQDNRRGERLFNPTPWPPQAAPNRPAASSVKNTSWRSERSERFGPRHPIQRSRRIGTGKR